MYYKNLIEDENEARTERVGSRIAYLLIIFGVLFFGYNYLKKKNN